MKTLVLVSLVMLALVIVSCAPRVAPAPAPAVQPTQVPSKVAVVPSAPAPTDANWDKVVEAARKEGKVSIYAFNFTGDAGVAIARGFKAATGIDADIITGRGAEFLERLKTEQRLGQRVGDIAEGGTIHLINMKNAGLLASSLDIPVLKKASDFVVDPLGLDKEGHVLNEGYILFAPYINTNLVKPGQEPRSWNDFLDPKWKGKILAHDPNVSMTWYNALVPLVNAGVLKVDFIREMSKQDLRFVTGDYDAVQKLSQGQAPLVLVTADVVSGAAVAEGAPIKAIPMSEGLPVSTVTIGAVKDSPHANAAKVFLNWHLSQEGQTVFHKARGTASVRKDVPDFRHPNVGVPANVKLIVMSKEDGDVAAKQFREKYYLELWKK